MSKKILIKKIKKLGFGKNEVAVSLEDYFNGNNVIGSIMANSYPDEVEPHKLFLFLNELKKNEKIQDILIRKCEIDEEWPYSDSIYLYTELTKEEIKKEFKQYLPDEIYNGWMYGEPNGKVSIIPPNNIYTIWWD